MADETQDLEDLEALPAGTRTRSASVIAGACILVFTIVFLLSEGFSEFFLPDIHVYTYLGDSGGIGNDADVLINGVTVGKVKRVDVATSRNPSRAVRLELHVQTRYQHLIPVDSIAALTADNLLGDKFINIAQGRATQSVGDGSEIASLIQSGPFNPADLVSSLQATMARINTIFDEIQKGDTPLALAVRGSDLYDSLLSRVSELQKTVQVAAGPKTMLGQMIKSDAVYQQTLKRVQGADKYLSSVERGEGPAGRLLMTSTQYDNALVGVRKIHQPLSDLNSGKSPNSRLLKSDEQYRDIQAQLNKLNQTVDSLLDGKGQFSQLLESRALYDSLTARSRSTGVFLKDFREEPQKYLRIRPFGSKHAKSGSAPPQSQPVATAKTTTP